MVYRAGEVAVQGVQSCNRPRRGVGWPGRRDACREQARASLKSSELYCGAGEAPFLTQCNCVVPFSLIRKLPPPRAAACPCGRRGLRADPQLVLSVDVLGSEGSHTVRQAGSLRVLLAFAENALCRRPLFVRAGRTAYGCNRRTAGEPEALGGFSY